MNRGTYFLIQNFQIAAYSRPWLTEKAPLKSHALYLFTSKKKSNEKQFMYV